MVRCDLLLTSVNENWKYRDLTLSKITALTAGAVSAGDS